MKEDGILNGNNKCGQELDVCSPSKVNQVEGLPAPSLAAACPKVYQIEAPDRLAAIDCRKVCFLAPCNRKEGKGGRFNLTATVLSFMLLFFLYYLCVCCFVVFLVCVVFVGVRAPFLACIVFLLFVFFCGGEEGGEIPVAVARQLPKRDTLFLLMTAVLG